MSEWAVIIAAAALGFSGAALLVLYLVERRSPRVVCLMYHRLTSREAHGSITGTERVFALPVDAFEQQIEYLTTAGYTFATAEQARLLAEGTESLPARSILITFDDCCRSVATCAEPILRRHNARATVFVTTDQNSWVFGPRGGNEPRLSDDEIRSLDGGSLQFESHCVTHRPLRGLADEDIRHELVQSKQELERLLTRPVEYLAIPGNWFDATVMRLAREAGYKAVWCSNPGAVHRGSNPYGFKRVNVEGEYTLRQFAAAIQPFGLAQRRFLSFIKRLPARLLGPRVWLPLRKVILRCIPGGHLSMGRMLVIGAGLVLVALAVIVICSLL